MFPLSPYLLLTKCQYIVLQRTQGCTDIPLCDRVWIVVYCGIFVLIWFDCSLCNGPGMSLQWNVKCPKQYLLNLAWRLVDLKHWMTPLRCVRCSSHDLLKITSVIKILANSPCRQSRISTRFMSLWKFPMHCVIQKARLQSWTKQMTKSSEVSASILWPNL